MQLSLETYKHPLLSSPDTARCSSATEHRALLPPAAAWELLFLKHISQLLLHFGCERVECEGAKECRKSLVEKDEQGTAPGSGEEDLFYVAQGQLQNTPVPQCPGDSGPFRVTLTCFAAVAGSTISGRPSGLCSLTHALRMASECTPSACSLTGHCLGTIPATGTHHCCVCCSHATSTGTWNRHSCWHPTVRLSSSFL